jgi:hypothetical protein
MIAAASFLLAAATLSLRLDAPQADVLIGEPVKLVLTWSSTKPVRERLTEPGPWFEIYSNNGSGWRRFDIPLASDDVVTAPDELRAGERLTTELTPVEGRYEGGKPAPLFRSAGRYSLRVVYRLNERESVTSNSVRFDVSAPKDEERDVYEIMTRTQGFLLTVQAEELSRRYPESRYLRIPALRRLQKHMDALLSRQDPENNESLRHLDREQLKLFVHERFQVMASELKSRGDWGGFEADRLEKLADLLDRAQQPDEALAVRHQLVQRFPSSRAAAVARRSERDERQGRSGGDEP